MTWWPSDRADAQGQSLPCLLPLSHGVFFWGYMALKILPWVKNSAPFIFGFGAVSFLLFGFIALKIWTIRIRNSCILFSYLVRYLFCFY